MNKLKQTFGSRDFIQYFILGLVLLTVTMFRVRMLDIPLERDEGEYAYMGQLILQGTPPYAAAYNMKFPGVYYIYAFFMAIFGQSVVGVHLGLLMVNFGAIVLVFLLAKKWFSGNAALAGAAAYALLSTGISVYGFAGHATQYLVLPALGGTFLLYQAVEGRRRSHFILSGIFLGIAILMKQPGFFFTLFGASFLFYRAFTSGQQERKVRIIEIVLFSLGVAVPLVLTAILLKIAGIFYRFWFWTIIYAADYGAQIPAGNIWPMFRDGFAAAISGSRAIWVLAGLGLATLFLWPKPEKKWQTQFMLLFVIFSFFSICPGFYFRPHYFVTLLPAIAILFGRLTDILLELAYRWKSTLMKSAAYALCLIPLAGGIVSQKEYFFDLHPDEIPDKVYGQNSFVQSIPVAEYIKNNSTILDRIAVMGSEPQLYFYSKRRAATGYIYMYSLMETHANSLLMQKEMVREIEAARPKFFVYSHIYTSWLVKPASETYLFEWFDAYWRNNFYQIRGVADIFPDSTVYKWNNAARNYTPKSEYYLLVFGRD